MVFVKVIVLLTVVSVFCGVKEIVGQDFLDDSDQQWPAGISPLEGLSYWNDDDDSSQMETEDNAQGCCMPQTWTGRLFTEIRRSGRRSELNKPSGRSLRFLEVVYVDQNNQRVAQDVTIPRRKNVTTISYILLFNGTQGATLYSFSKTAKKCFKKELKGAQFRPMCLPANATLFGSFAFGAGSQVLNVQSWGFKFHDRRVSLFGSVILTPANCVPVLASNRIITRPRLTDEDPDKKRPQVTDIGSLYTDVKTQIPDPSVFTPPSYCTRASDDLIFDPNVDFTTIVERFVTIP